jgi:hypothetical protein
MSPAVVSGGFRAGWSVAFEAQAAIMECAVGRRGAGIGAKGVREALPVGSAGKFSGGLVAASGPSEGLGTSAGVMTCRRSGGMVWA